VKRAVKQVIGWLLGFLWKDAKMFSVDRQAVVMSFVVPVLIASILGWLDSKASEGTPNSLIQILVDDQDHSAISASILRRLSTSDSVTPVARTWESAKAEVQTGRATFALMIPSGFGKLASSALIGGPKAGLTTLSDPSKPEEVQISKGSVIGAASFAAASESFGGLAGNGEAPVTLLDAQPNGASIKWGKAAHDYSGFGLQGLLFFAIESAVALSRERRLGIWKRLRSAPVPPSIFLLARGLSSTILAFCIILTVFGFGALLFGIRVLGSYSGFFGIAFAAALMAGTFGLLMATLGRTETQSRGISILLILIMLATGGAWFPIQQMPAFVQSAARFLPVKWAVEGFDAVTWRGLGFAEAATFIGPLLAFSVVFALLALLRFRNMREAG